MTQQKTKLIHKIALSGTIAMFLMCFLGSAIAPVSYTWYWSSDVRFGLSGYGTSIGFTNNIHLSSFTFNNGTSITYSNIYMGDGNVAEIILSTQTSNMTIGTISDTKLDYEVTGLGTQVINLGDKQPTHVKLDGVTVMQGIGYTYSGGEITVANALSTANISFTATETDIFIPTSRGEWTTEDWYFRSDTWTVNTELGYKLYTTQSEATTYTQSTSTSLEDFTVSLKVYRVSTDGDVIPITDDIIAEATQSSLTAGTMLNTTYTLSETTDNLDLKYDDAIQVVFYHQLGTDDPTAKAEFITTNIKSDKLNSNTWSIYYYVTVTEDAGTYYYRFYYGDASTNSRIANIQYETLDPWGTGLYHLGQGDLISFILNPYSYYIGQELAFGIFAMILIIPAYNRYKDIRPVAVLCLLFAGTGGFLTIFIPAIALKISFLFLAVGVAIMLYKLIR